MLICFQRSGPSLWKLASEVEKRPLVAVQEMKLMVSSGFRVLILGETGA